MPDTHNLKVGQELDLPIPQSVVHAIANNHDRFLSETIKHWGKTYDIDDGAGWRAPGTLVVVRDQQYAQQFDQEFDQEAGELAIKIAQHCREGQPFPELGEGWYWVDEDVVLVALHHHAVEVARVMLRAYVQVVPVDEDEDADEFPFYGWIHDDDEVGYTYGEGRPRLTDSLKRVLVGDE